MSKKLKRLKRGIEIAKQHSSDCIDRHRDSQNFNLCWYEIGAQETADLILEQIDKLIKEPKPMKQKTNYDNIDLRQELKKQKIRKHQIWECKTTARYIEVNEIDKTSYTFKAIFYNYTGNKKQFMMNTTGFYNKFRFIKDVKNEN